MGIDWFDGFLKPLLVGFRFDYSSFSDGDLGSLDRVEIEGAGKLATIEFWSKGWVSFDIYDCAIDEQVMNIILSPEEEINIPKTVDDFLAIMKDVE